MAQRETIIEPARIGDHHRREAMAVEVAATVGHWGILWIGALSRLGFVRNLTVQRFRVTYKAKAVKGVKLPSPPCNARRSGCVHEDGCGCKHGLPSTFALDHSWSLLRAAPLPMRAPGP